MSELATVPGYTALAPNDQPSEFDWAMNVAAQPPLPKDYRSPEWVKGYKAGYGDAKDEPKLKRAAMLAGNRPIEAVWDGCDNDELIAAAARLWIPAGAVVLDPTYGRGIFYKRWAPETLIAHDLYTLDGVDFRDLPEDDESVDVVIFDPPYVLEGGRETSTVPEMLDRYGTGLPCPTTLDELFAMNGIGMEEAERVLRPKGILMVKSMNFISSGSFVQGHKFVVDLAEALDLEQVDEFVLNSGPGPQPKTNRDGTLRRQVHSRNVHSFLSIFRKPRRRQ